MFTLIRKKIDILRHEAGHMIVARVLGFETGYLKYEKEEAGAELTPAAELSDIPSIIGYLERRLPVLYAGAMAESLRANEIDNALVNEILDDHRGKNDFAKVRELLQIYSGLNRGLRSAEEVHQENSNRVWFRAGTLVEKYAPEIISLSKDFLQSVGGRDVHKIEASEIMTFSAFSDLVPGCEIAAMSVLEAPADMLVYDKNQNGGTQ